MQVHKGTFIHKKRSIVMAILKAATNAGFKASLTSIGNEYKVVVK